MLDALDVAQSAGLDLRRRGGKYWARCPFHSERTPSFAIYPDGRGWYCFSCHRGGDAAALYQQLYNVSIKDALRAVGKDELAFAPVRSAGEELRRKVERWPSRKPCWRRTRPTTRRFGIRLKHENKRRACWTRWNRRRPVIWWR